MNYLLDTNIISEVRKGPRRKSNDRLTPAVSPVWLAAPARYRQFGYDPENAVRRLQRCWQKTETGLMVKKGKATTTWHVN